MTEAVENRIPHALEPFLDNRQQLYRALARTNFLLDLAFARPRARSPTLDEVALLLREAHEVCRRVGTGAPDSRRRAATAARR